MSFADFLIIAAFPVEFNLNTLNVLLTGLYTCKRFKCKTFENICVLDYVSIFPSFLNEETAAMNRFLNCVFTLLHGQLNDVTGDVSPPSAVSVNRPLVSFF